MISSSPATAAHPTAGPAGRSGPAARCVCRRPIPKIAANPRTPAPRPWLDNTSDNERRLYGALMADVVLLRRRGFGVHREGDLFRVGNRLVTAGGVVDLAARERRLNGGK